MNGITYDVVRSRRQEVRRVAESPDQLMSHELRYLPARAPGRRRLSRRRR